MVSCSPKQIQTIRDQYGFKILSLPPGRESIAVLWGVKPLMTRYGYSLQLAKVSIHFFQAFPVYHGLKARRSAASAVSHSKISPLPTVSCEEVV